MNPFSGKNILWVEDDQFLGSMIEKKFQKTGCNLTHVIDGESALKALETMVPDLAIIDLILPGVDGFEIVKALKTSEKTKNVPTIVLSNLSDEADINKAKGCGADLYLVKASLTLDEIMHKVEPFLSK